MDNNSYEQDFIKNVKQTKQPAAPSRSTSKTTTSTSMLPTIVAIILGLIVLVESVALVIFAINYGVVLDLYGDSTIEYVDEETEGTPESLSESSSYEYDEDFNVVAFDLICSAEGGSRYEFAKSGAYQKTDSGSNLLDSGTYSILENSVVVLKNPDRTEDEFIYYDGYDVIIEDDTFYDCE